MAVEQFVDSDRRWLLWLGLDAQSLLYIRRIRNWIYDGRLSRPPSAASKIPHLNSATKRCPSSAAISSSINSNSHSSVYITPPVAAFSFVTSRRSRSRPRDLRSRHRLVPRRTLSPSAACLFVQPSLQLFLKVRHRIILQCSPNKDGGRRLYTDLRLHTLPHR